MPIIAAGAIAGAGALGAGAFGFMGASKQAKAAERAARMYIDYLQGQRDTFLRQPEVGPIRSKLAAYSRGELPDYLSNQIQEDYGKSLADMTRLIPKAGVQPGGGYTPGRRERTARLLGENIAANKANTMRAAKQEGERFAISSLPTWMPGTPSTPIADPGTFMTSAGGNQPNIFSFLGPTVGQAGQYGGLAVAGGPILDRLYGNRNPLAAATMDIPQLDTMTPMSLMSGTSPYYSRFASSFR